MPNQSRADDESPCECMPYKDAVLITGQGLSLGALFFSWTSWASWCVGLVACILLQIVWCCRLNKCGLIVGGVFAAIAGAVGIIVGGIFLATNNSNCYYYNNYDDFYYSTYYTCSGPTYVTRGILQLIGAALMIGAAVCTFTFTCGARFLKYHPENDGGETGEDYGDRKPNDDPPRTVEAIAVTPIPGKKSKTGKKKTKKNTSDDGTAVSNLTTGSASKTITHMPDGSIKTEIETINPDGSKQITTTIEKPLEPTTSAIDEDDDSSSDEDVNAANNV